MLDIPAQPDELEGRKVEPHYTAEFLRVKGMAERGVPSAQHSLGFMYANGQGVAQNYELAVAWYRMAASADLELAQYNLGVMYPVSYTHLTLPTICSV